MMDANNVNFIRFLWIRRLNYAWATCSTGTFLQPNRIVCALSITSPRMRTLNPSEEKSFFTTSVIL